MSENKSTSNFWNLDFSQVTVASIDLETTGLIEDLNSEIWEVAVNTIEPGGLQLSDSWYVQHDALYASENLPEKFRIDHDNRYNEGDALTPAETYQKLSELIGPGGHIIGAMPSTDEAHLRRLFISKLQIRKLPWHYHIIDIEAMILGYCAAKGFRAPIPWKSDDLSRFIGIGPPDKSQRHTASGDSAWALAVFMFIMNSSLLSNELTQLHFPYVNTLPPRKSNS